MARDIALNPRPVSFLCQVCSSPVTHAQRGLECDTFRQWIHTKCASVDIQQYHDFTAQENFYWCCPPCLLSQLPFTGSESDVG